MNNGRPEKPAGIGGSAHQRAASSAPAPISPADPISPTDPASPASPAVLRRASLRTEMIAIAGRIIAETGVRSLNARDIARTAGCAVGTLYNLFPDLDALILEVQRETLGRFEEQALLSLEVTEQEPEEERLVALAHTYLAFALENPGRWRALFEHQLPPGYAIPAWYEPQERRLFEIVAELVRPLLAALPAEQALTTGRALWAAVHGIIWLSLTGKIGPVSADETQSNVETIVRAVARGFAVRR